MSRGHTDESSATLSARRSSPLRVIVILPIACWRASTPAAPHPITIDDYFQVREVDDPQISADGQWVAYTVSTSSLKDDENKSRIWMVATAGGDAVPMTSEEESSDHPRWSPDGKYLAFLSKRDEGKTQVWLLNRIGGEAQPLTETIQDVKDFAWSPDSKRLVLMLQDPSPGRFGSGEGKSAGEERGQGDRKTRSPKRSVRGWLTAISSRKMRLVIWSGCALIFTSSISPAKTLTQVTSGDFDDEHPAWSPDGKFLAFSSKRTGPDPDRNYDSNICVVAADNTDKGAHLTQVTTSPGLDDSPAWSPDGKWIAYVTQLDPKLSIYGTNHIAVSPAGGGEAKILTTAFDRVSSEPHFSPDGKSIYFIADDDGTQNLCQRSRRWRRGHASHRRPPDALRLFGCQVRRSGGADHHSGSPQRDFHHSRRQAHSDHAHQRRLHFAGEAHRARVREVQEQRRHHCLRLSLQAARLRAGKEISGHSSSARRAGLGLLRRVHASGAALRGQRLRGAVSQPARLNRLRTGLRQGY